jgi:STE24 endopeptidase
VRRLFRHQVSGSLLVAALAAELATRLLTPREAPIKPAEIDLREYFSDEQITRGARFARPQLALALARGAVDAGALVTVARQRPPAWLENMKPPALGGAVAGAGLSIALTLPPLPLSAVARRRAIKVGLVTQSWRGWALDLVKSTLIGAGLAGLGGALAVAGTERWPRTWWLPAAGGSVAAGALFAALGPVLLDPVFNSFEPLPEGSEIRNDVLALAETAGVKVGEVYSVDASRRTTAANAYVTGIGPTKRVVLFDTLLDRYSRDEIRVVVAHELAHVRHRDVPRGVLYAALVAPAMAFAVQRVSSAISPERSGPAAVPVLALAAAVVSAPTGLLGNRLSRAIERRADDFSLALSGAPEAFVSFERTIAVQNVADLEPPSWVSKLLASHPPTRERIGAAVAWSHRQGNAATAPKARPRRTAGPLDTQAGS